MRRVNAGIREEVSDMQKTITVRRSGALGDVILTTPVIRRLRAENPDAWIEVETAYPDVFAKNPHVNAVNGKEAVRLINLDLAYETSPDLHIVRAYMMTAFSDYGIPDELQQEVFQNRRKVFEQYPERPYVAIHAAQAGWRNRTLPRSTWKRVIEGLRKEGLFPVLVGTERDMLDDGVQITRFCSTNIRAHAQLIQSCRAFIGSDSAMLHIAGATDVPIIGVFTCAMPHTRLPWRHGELGWNCDAVVPPISCTGCLARREPPVTTEYCERGDTACVKRVDPDEIVKAALQLIENKIVS